MMNRSPKTVRGCINIYKAEVISQLENNTFAIMRLMYVEKLQKLKGSIFSAADIHNKKAPADEAGAGHRR
jgi:hypothetical protein